jgi:hypothetical protein
MSKIKRLQHADMVNRVLPCFVFEVLHTQKDEAREAWSSEVIALEVLKYGKLEGYPIPMLTIRDQFGRVVKRSVESYFFSREDADKFVASSDAKKFGYLALVFCNKALPLKVMKSRAGYYIGTADDMPVSRESERYWRTEKEAENALTTGDWQQLENP